MARSSSSSSKKGEENAESTERRRLKKLAVENSILSETPARNFTPLSPSKQVMKHHGKDIVRKSQRKNRFLFSFPGLFAPISGGKIGELKHLGTKNPVMYLDFPQGRMKLFGTIVYPKNKYLTLQFSRGGKNVMCEDYFDNMIVFSDAWWIGSKDENPEEARLEFPKELSEEQQKDYDFQGGAGVVSTNKKEVPTETKYVKEKSPEVDFKESSSDDENSKEQMEVTPGRQSARIAGKNLKYTEISSEDDPVGSDVEALERKEKKVSLKLNFSTVNDSATKSNYSCPVVLDVESDDAAEELSSKQIEVLTTPATKTQSAIAASREKSHGNHGPLVQATISTLFKKVEQKQSTTSKKRSSSKGFFLPWQLLFSLSCGITWVKLGGRTTISLLFLFQAKGSRKKQKLTEENTGTGHKAKKKKREAESEDIEELSSMSKEFDGSDEDWTG